MPNNVVVCFIYSLPYPCPTFPGSDLLLDLHYFVNC
uniref:Uncharacterized protein n=1 Tax=Anguilla anguilla TaxID=7936 RepID=A0A0E9U3K1_ANGAN